MSASDDPKPEDAAYPLGRKFAYANALASARIEGYEPDADSLERLAALEAGNITGDEFMARTRARVKVMEAEIAARKEAGASE